MIVDGLYYTEEHEWVKLEGDIATIGIADHAQEALGEITYVELPETGTEVDVKGEMAVVESTKAASDVYSPLSGTVTDIGPRSLPPHLAALHGSEFGANLYHVNVKATSATLNKTTHVDAAIVRLFKMDDDQIFRTSGGG